MNTSSVSRAQLTFARHDGTRVQIGPAALETIRKHLQNQPHIPESGGVLLGRHLLETDDIVVDLVTTPQPGDRQQRHWFFRRRRCHQELINRAWQESEGTCTYLGEWHTHPESDPTPSWIDLLDWQRKLAFDHFTEPIFFVIAGTAETRAWEGRRRSHVTALRRIDER